MIRFSLLLRFEHRLIMQKFYFLSRRSVNHRSVIDDALSSTISLVFALETQVDSMQLKMRLHMMKRNDWRCLEEFCVKISKRNLSRMKWKIVKINKLKEDFKEKLNEDVVVILSYRTFQDIKAVTKPLNLLTLIIAPHPRLRNHSFVSSHGNLIFLLRSHYRRPSDPNTKNSVPSNTKNLLSCHFLFSLIYSAVN